MGNSSVVGILRALLTLDTAQFESGIRKADKGLQTFSRSTRQAGLQAQQIGSQLTRLITLPILGVSAAASKAAVDFESSFAGVRKTVNASEAEFAKLAQSMRGLAKEIPINVNELNKLGEAAGALAVPKEEIVDFVRVMAQLGVTTNVTAEQAAESIAQIQTVFQAAGKNTDRFAATLVDLGNKGASTEAQILELSNRLASAGRAIGLSQADVLGFASAIANVGIEAEAGGTAISKVFSDISMAVSMGGEDLDAFAKVAGKSTEEFAKAFKDDAAAAVAVFIEGLGKAHAAGGDLNLILTDLGFKEARQARALRDLALSGKNLGNAINIANDAWRANSALTEEARKRFETTASQLTLLWNRLKDVGITLGNALLPLIKTMISGLDTLVPLLERAAQVFAAMPVPIQAAAVALGLAVAAVGPLLIGFGQLALSASALAGAFTKKGIATKALTALMSGTGGLTAAVRAAGVAFTASATAVGIFTGALAAIVVPLALIKVAELIGQIRGLIKDSEQWRMNAVEENAAHLRVLAEASKVAGREITNYTEAMSILRGRIATLQEAQRLGGAEFQGLTIVTDLYGKSQTAAANAAGALAKATDSMRAKLAAARAVISGLTAAQRGEIDAGIALNHSNEDIAKSFAKLFPKVKVTEEVIGLYKDQLSAAGSAAKKAAKDFNELTGVTARADAVDLAKKLDSGSIQVARLTADAQREVLETLGAGIDSWRALGEAVPASVQRQFDAAMKLRGVVDMLTEVREFTRDFGDELTKKFWADQREQAEASGSAMLASIVRAGEAQRDTAAIGRDIQIRRAEHAMEMARLEGKGWEELAAIDMELSALRLDAAKASIHERFALETAMLDKASLEYQALEAKYQAVLQQMDEDHRLSETKKREELRRTHSIWIQSFERLKDGLKDIQHQLTGNLASMLFGVGQDNGAKEAAADAKAHYEELKRTGKASAEELTRAFRDWRKAEEQANSGFADRFKGLWQNIKQSLIDTLDSLLSYFVNSFLKGMVKAIAGSGFGQAVGGLINKAIGLGGGSITGAVLGTGGNVATAAAGGVLFGGGGIAGGMLGVGAAPSLATLLGTAPGTAGAAGAAAGAGGAGLGGALIGLATNPITIGAAAAIGGALLLKKLFSGPSKEERQGRSSRKAFTDWLLGTLNPTQRQEASSAEGGMEWAGSLIAIRDAYAKAGRAPEQGVAAHAALLKAETKGAPEVQSVIRGISAVLERAGLKAPPELVAQDLATRHAAGMADRMSGQMFGRRTSFALGGFVPPNAVVPAILHGGPMGEAIVPLEKAQKQIGGALGGSGTKHITLEAHFHNLDPRSIRQTVKEQVWPELRFLIRTDAEAQATVREAAIT